MDQTRGDPYQPLEAKGSRWNSVFDEKKKKQTVLSLKGEVLMKWWPFVETGRNMFKAYKASALHSTWFKPTIMVVCPFSSWRCRGVVWAQPSLHSNSVSEQQEQQQQSKKILKVSLISRYLHRNFCLGIWNKCSTKYICFCLSLLVPVPGHRGPFFVRRIISRLSVASCYWPLVVRKAWEDSNHILTPLWGCRGDPHFADKGRRA